MTKTLSKACLAIASAALLPSVAWAQAAPEGNHFYASGAVSASFLRNSRTVVDNAPAPGAQIVTSQVMDDGWGGSVALGRSFGIARAEAELGFANNDGDTYKTLSPFQNEVDTDTSLNSMRLMLNGYIDLLRGPVTPYVGAGIGMARIEFRVFAPRAPFPTESPRELIDDKDSKLAYQLIAGASVAVAPRLAVTGQYRWFNAGTFKGEDSRSEPFAARYRGHHLDVGVRLSF